MKNDDFVDFSAINRPYERRRNNAKWRYRCREGVKQLFIKPLKIIPILFLITVYIVVWYMLDVFITYIITSPFISYLDRLIASITTKLMLIPTITYFVKGMVSVFFLLLLIGLLSWLGKPRRAEEVEDDVASALKVTEAKNRYKRPFLISYKLIGRDVMEYVFYSRWMSLEKFKDPDIESDLLTALDCSRIEEYQYGGRKRKSRRIIVLRVKPGAELTERGDIYDEEI